MKKIWMGTLVAESGNPVGAAGSACIAIAALMHGLVQASRTGSVCPWLGVQGVL